jgi:hypothetical protein
MPIIKTKGAASSQGFGEFTTTVTPVVSPNYVEDVFSTWLYTGNGVGGAITNNINLSAYGGMVWTKSRSLGFDNWLLDTARSLSNGPIKSNAVSGELGFQYGINSWLTTGYYTTNDNAFQNSGTTFVSWTFRKQEKFFDVVTWTGNGTNRTIAHNLGSVPGCILVKRLDTSSGWRVYHRSLTNTEALALNDNGAKTTSSTYWNSTTATSSVFSLGTDGNVNSNTSTYVAYLFAHDAGGFGNFGSDNVISCGSFTSDIAGVDINLGYEPQWVMVKVTNSVGLGWYIWDSMRGFPVGTDGVTLQANSSGAESATGWISPTVTGFKVNAGQIATGNPFIYIAIRRGPMKVPTTGTSVFTPVTYTGDGTSLRTITTNIVTDMIIGGNRSSPAGVVNDRLRGQVASYTTTTDAESTSSVFPEFDVMDGYINLANGGDFNSTGGSFIRWAFRRAPRFFDEVCYAGTSTNRYQQHSLTVVPELIFVKCRNSASTGWITYSAATGPTKYMKLNNTDAATTDSTFWNDLSPTSTTFSLGLSAEVNSNSVNQTYVAYLFATCAGVSKVGSFTGTGALQTIDCGFTAGSRFVLIKRTSASGEWYVWDSARGITSGNDPYLFLNSTAAEITTENFVDTTSVGFQVTAAATGTVNISGQSYIFLAIA